MTILKSMYVGRGWNNVKNVYKRADPADEPDPRPKTETGHLYSDTDLVMPRSCNNPVSSS
jgi:hypothetical protein